MRDEFNEAEYSPALFDQKLVMEMLRSTIIEKRTNQKFVIVEGLCNSHKFQSDDERLELRNMDELWQIERHIGEIKAIIGLQFAYEPETIDAKDIEKIAEGDVDAAHKRIQAAMPPPGEDGGPAEVKPAVKAQEWTETDKKPKNLPQLFLSCKGEKNTTNEVRTAEQFSSS